MKQQEKILPSLFYRLLREHTNPVDWPTIKNDRILGNKLTKSYDIRRLMERLQYFYLWIYNQVAPHVNWFDNTFPQFEHYLDFRDVKNNFDQLDQFCKHHGINWQGDTEFKKGKIFTACDQERIKYIVIRNNFCLLYGTTIYIKNQPLLSAKEWMKAIEEEFHKLDEMAHKIIC